MVGKLQYLKSRYLLSLDSIVVYILVCWFVLGDQAIDIEEFTHADPSRGGGGVSGFLTTVCDVGAGHYASISMLDEN